MYKLNMPAFERSTASEVLIGFKLLDKIGEILLAKLHSDGQDSSALPRLACISDSNVAPLYLARLQNSLASAGFKSYSITIEAGEKSKNHTSLQYIIAQLSSENFNRKDIIVALGGGMISDIAGFAASIFLRGIRFITIATSLLAQIDASIGGKTGINTELGKNLVGSFYSSMLIVNDLELLESLALSEFRAGYAEMVKYGLINDVSFFKFCQTSLRAIMARSAALEQAINYCVQAKLKITASDYFEQNDRALLNLGHSFAHGLEAASGYKILHGEAVAVGMALAFDFSNVLGYANIDTVARVVSHLNDAGLPTNIEQLQLPQDINARQLLALMRQDKKNTQSGFTLILARNIGQSFVAPNVAPDLLHQFLEKKLDRKS